MIKVGDRRPTTYWGYYTVEKIVALSKPVLCECDKKGEALFNPVFMKVEWDKSPSNKKDKHEFWFRYWIAFGDQKEKYGQFAPIMDENTLSELLQKAINENFFSNQFLKRLHEVIELKINSN
jgi:hypothetical protein